METNSFGAPIKHLLVDLDGTLLGNRPLPMIVEFLKHAFQLLKPYGNWKQTARALLSIPREFANPSSLETNDVRVIRGFSTRMNLSLEEGRRVLKEGVLVIFPNLQRYFYPMPGAREFLDWAKSHFPLTLATNPVWPREVIEMRVRWAGLDPSLFVSITDVRKMTACKPKREYYEGILSQQGLRAEDCLLIGNEVRMDLPATEVGIRVFLVGRSPQALPIRYEKGQAPAWKGSFNALREALEANLQARVASSTRA